MLLLPLVLLAALASPMAELPPGSYDNLRAESDDAVTIQVKSVKAVVGDKKEVSVEAMVLGVERSKSGLKKNDSIAVHYWVWVKPVPGPRPIPILEKGGVYPAFLNKREKGYEPAAHGMSFKMTPEAIKR